MPNLSFLTVKGHCELGTKIKESLNNRELYDFEEDFAVQLLDTYPIKFKYQSPGVKLSITMIASYQQFYSILK